LTNTTSTKAAYALRHELGLCDVRIGCGEGYCGACTVLVDGKPTTSCDLPLLALEDKSITTVRGLGSPERPHAVQSAFVEEQAGQCGYCLSGILMTSAALLDAGYYVFMPNPRGSYGQGEAFTAANRRDFGGGDLRDILAGIDAVEKIAPVDDARLGLTGGSYGGFMSMWANTKTNRFKAIVAGAGLSNWISYYGTNGIDQWMIQFFGKSAYDDPEAYRAVSLLLRRPPGREAYPGDVFYLHSRLLERCAKLSDEMGKGSMTGLPIIETKANDVSAFIPTNVISITDGQIFLQSDLFAANQRPAIDVGVSVSRVGGSAMTKAMKAVTGSLKVDLAQFRAMEAFAMFASDLDAASRQQLDRGQRLMALLKQPQYSPYPVEEMTVSLWTGTSGRLDKVPTEDVLRFENEFLDYLRRSHEGILAGIRETSKFEDSTADQLAQAYDSFLDQFETSDGQSIKAGKEEHVALEDEDVEQEQIVKQKRG